MTYRADIEIGVKVEKALAGVGRVEKAISKISQNKINIDISGRLKTEARDIQRSWSIIKKGAQDVGNTVSYVTQNWKQLGIAITAVEASARLSKFLGLKGGLTAVGIAAVDAANNLASFVAQNAILSSEIAIGTTALIAFGPQLARAAGDALKLGKAAAYAKAPLKDLLNAYSTYTGAFDSAFASIDKVEVTNAVIEKYRRTLYELSETVSELGRRQNSLQGALNNTNSSSETAAKIAGKLVDVTKRLNTEQARQNTLLEQAARAQRDFNDQARVYTNISRSAASRAGSGFADFSRAASGVTSGLDQQAIDKSIRRQRDKIARAFRDMPAMQAPLMLPSSEMLNASQRGIKQLSSYYGDLNTQIDLGVQKGRAFTEQLNAQAAKAQTLPPIFTQFETAITNAANALKPSAQIQQSWAEALQQGAMWSKQNAALDKEALALADQKVLAEREITFEKRLQERLDKKARAATKARAASQKVLGGRISSAAIGGAFPALFGQSGLASIGGAVGGFIGGAGGGFAGSLVGTLIGDLVSAGNEVKALAEEMGLGENATRLLGEAFKTSGAEADKFAAAVQNIRGVGFADAEQVEVLRLVSKLTDDYGGKIDRVAQAYANIALSGKASLSSILQINQQNIPLLQQLEKALGKNRSQILQLAKDGKISAQQVADALVQIANNSDNTNKRIKGNWEKAWGSIVETIQMVVRAWTVVARALIGTADTATGSISTSFAGLVRGMVEGFIWAGRTISRILADIANTVSGYASAFTLGGLNPLAKGVEEKLAQAGAAFKRIDEGLAKIKPAEGITGDIGGVTLPGLQDGGGAGGGKGSGKERESRISALQEELRLAQQLAGINDKIRAAEFDQDQALQIRLKGEADVLKLASDISMVRLSDAPVAEKLLEIAKLEIAIRERQKDTTLELATLERDRLRSFQNTIEGLELELASSKAITREELNRLEIEKKRLALRDNKDLTPAQKDAIILLEEKLQKQGAPLQSFITDAERQLKDLEQIAVNVSQGIGSAIANSMSQGIVGLMEGTKDAQQVFADFLKSVGDILIQEGTRMIAMYIAIAIAKAFAGLGGKGGGAETDAQFMERTGNLDLAGDSYKGLQGFATGGFVTGPTRAVVGEGGEPEYIIPASKMRSAMNRYAAGARGSSVIPGSGEQAAGEMGGGTAVAAPIDVRYTVERINSVDYVTADQFRSGMQQAAEQGARRGEQRTLANIRQNTTTRRKLGL